MRLFPGWIALALITVARAEEMGLVLKPGVPLQVALEGRPEKRPGQRLQGRLVQPVWVFHRQVLPAGSLVRGRVAGLQPIPWSRRLQSYLHGRLRIEREALVVFEEIVKPDGESIGIATSSSSGTPQLIRVAAGGPAKTKPGRVQTVKEKAKAAVLQNEAVVKTRATGLSGGVKQALRSSWRLAKPQLVSYWPFGRQRLAEGSAYTAVVLQPLHFGFRPRPNPPELPAHQLPPDSLVFARLVDPLTSRTARPGSPFRAVVTRPLLGQDGQLILPEGAEISGEVVRASPARRFGRNGQLRLRFTGVHPAPGASEPTAVLGSLEAVHASSAAGLRLDREGAARIPWSRKRLLAPVLATTAAGTAPEAESSFTAHGAAPGWSGFGLAGTAIALAAPSAAGPLGWWGSAASIYTNLIRKTGEVVFPANTMIEIRFGRSPGEEKHAVGSGGTE